MSQKSSTSALSLSKDQNPSEQYVEYSILAGDYEAAMRTLENSRQTQAAKTVKFVQLAGSFPSNKVSDRHQFVNSDSSQPLSLFDLGPKQIELKKFTDEEAMQKFA